MVHEAGALTSNQTLIKWLPGHTTIDDLLAATAEQRTQLRDEEGGALVRVAYQTPVAVVWGGSTQVRTGRTLEEAFALQNLTWTQHLDRKDLGLRIKGSNNLEIAGIAERLYRKVKSSSFRKTDFALGLLAQEPSAWAVPNYISDGLRWLEDLVAPPPPAVTEAEEPLNGGEV
ncbi:hypothetical protein D3C76_1347360 [compost metagenome]